MAEVPGYPLSNLVLYAVVAVSPTLAFALLLGLPRLLRRIRAHRAVPERPANRPIQTVAADLRRVHRTLSDLGEGTSAVRRAGARQAYDALLVQACAALEIEHRLSVLAEGLDRDLERLRVEDRLQAAGLVIR